MISNFQFPISDSATARRHLAGQVRSVSNRQLAIGNRQSAFTLIELMVVVGIIVVMLGLAVAAFNQITGSRSIAMASNQVSAFLSLARSRSLAWTGAENRSCGILFYRDPQTGRSAMMAVWVPAANDADPEANDRYKGWTTNVSYIPGDRVVALTLDTKADAGLGYSRILTKTYRCKQNQVSNTNNRPPLSGPVGGKFENAYWAEVLPGTVEPVADIDVQFLPSGVSAQTVNDSGNVANTDRYLRTGLILFDRQGHLDYQYWSIDPATFAGQTLGLGAALPVANTVHSQLGLVLYDEGKFSADSTHSDNDWIFRGSLPGLADPANWAAENSEETWLDQNTTLLLINRANGSLIKGE